MGRYLCIRNLGRWPLSSTLGKHSISFVYVRAVKGVYQVWQREELHPLKINMQVPTTNVGLTQAFGVGRQARSRPYRDLGRKATTFVVSPVSPARIAAPLLEKRPPGVKVLAILVGPGLAKMGFYYVKANTILVEADPDRARDHLRLTYIVISSPYLSAKHSTNHSVLRMYLYLGRRCTYPTANRRTPIDEPVGSYKPQPQARPRQSLRPGAAPQMSILSK